MFDDLLLVPNKKGIKFAHVSGFFYGYSQFMRFFFVAIVFYISAVFVNKQNDDPKNTYLAVYILFIAAVGSGMAISSVPPLGKARKSAENIFEIIDEKSKISSKHASGEKIITRGEIELVNVDFKYPSRKEKVLDSINMKIPATKKIALVGHSGCGKSTIANLLLRLYDIAEGQILIDGKDIREYNVGELRR